MPDCESWNLSGGLAEAAVAVAIGAKLRTPERRRNGAAKSPVSVLAPMRASATSETIGAWAGRF